MNKKLVIISISKVQDFIIKNDKTKNLYGASTTVKIIVNNIGKQLSKNYGDNVNFIIPNDLKGKENLVVEVPNFLLVEIKTELNENDLEVKIKNQIMGMQELPEHSHKLQLFVAAIEMSENAYKEDYLAVRRKLQGYKANRLAGYIWSEKNKKSVNDTIKAPSTSSISSIQWRNKNKGIVEELDKLKEILKEEEDGENFEEIYYIEDRKKYITNYGKNIEGIKNIEEVGSPSSYYALIRMDVDDLGKHLAGEYCKEQNGISNLREFHGNIYKYLNKYGEAVKRELNDIPILGSQPEESLSIYTGGDDVLFFCPLHKVLEVLKTLKEKFQNTTSGLGIEISFSTSIVIAHRKNPLKQVVQLSQKNLEEVKQYYAALNKGGVALTMIYQGGNIRKSFLRGQEVYNIMKQIVEAFQKNGTISRSFIYALQEELRPISQKINTIKRETLFLIVKNEIGRISERKIEDGIIFQDSLDVFILNNILHLEHYLNFLNIMGKWANELEEEEMKDGILC